MFRQARPAIAIVLSSICLTTAVAVHAQEAAPVMSVRQLLDEGKDDQTVTVRGKLTKHMGGDRYVFADSTGEMQVDIDRRYFPMGQTIAPTDTLELTGEFEKETNAPSELDVKQLKRIDLK
jgi:uncharacterized protein (TIGR00156 family)